jgi:hypothetical protein
MELIPYLYIASTAISFFMVSIRYKQVRPYAKTIVDEINVMSAVGMITIFCKDRFNEDGEKYRISAIFWLKIFVAHMSLAMIWNLASR